MRKNKSRLFGLVLSVSALAFIACSQPLKPYGSWYRPGGGGGGINVPDWEDGSPRNIIEQLQWLQLNAQTGEVYYVWARLNEPQIPGNNNFGIEYNGRNNITVYIRTYHNIPTQTLRLCTNSTGAMLNIGYGNTLILQNIELQGHDTPTPTSSWDEHLEHFFHPLIRVREGGKLEMNSASVIHSSLTGVFVDGGSFTMRDNARVTDSYWDGVAVRYGDFTMKDNATVTANARIGGNSFFLGAVPFSGVALAGGRLTMQGDSSVADNYGNGVLVMNSLYIADFEYFTPSHVYDLINNITSGELTMKDNASIINNNASGITANFGGRIYMNDRATVRDNGLHALHNSIPAVLGGGAELRNLSVLTMNGHASVANNIGVWTGGVLITRGSYLNMHSDDTWIGGNVNVGLWGGGGLVSMNTIATINISGGTIYGDNAPDSRRRNVAVSNHAFCGGHHITVGSYTNGFTPNSSGTTTITPTSNTVKVRNNGSNVTF